jgi:streptomycin 6-kinase
VNLPPDFIDRIRGAYPNGAQWLDELPALVERAARNWRLTDITPVPNLSYNFVAFAQRGLSAETRRAGMSSEIPVVLKIGPPNNELASELAALRLFNGDGAVRLLEADDDNFTFLLERLRPGRMLAELDDDKATRIAAEVMLRLWREVPSESEKFIRLSDWFGALGQLRSSYDGGTGPFPTQLVERVEAILPALFADPLPPVLMHGDFHHFNVLSSGDTWVAIDPKGVIGPRGYECGPLLINPWEWFAEQPDPVQITQRRVAVLSERLGLERQVILGWGICHALLSAWWDFEDGAGGGYALRCGEILLRAR